MRQTVPGGTGIGTSGENRFSPGAPMLDKKTEKKCVLFTDEQK